MIIVASLVDVNHLLQTQNKRKRTKIFILGMRTLRIYSVKLLCITYSSVNHINHLYFIPLVLIHPTTKFISTFEQLHLIPISPASDTHDPDLFFSEFGCLFVEV